MGTYCGNHVLAVVREYSDQAKDGEVTIKKTKEGSCGQMGGCTTAHDDLFALKYESNPPEKEESKPEPPPEPEPETTDASGTGEDTGTTTTEKPAEVVTPPTP